MSWVAIIVDPNDNKVKINWFSLKKKSFWYNLRKSVLIYIFLDYKYSSYCYSISFSIFRFPSLRASLLFYSIFSLSSLPFTCRLDC